MADVEVLEKFKWCGFCFDCESVVVEDADFWFVIAIADLHADEHHHLVGVQTWVDKRIKKEAPKCSSV
jgi:hypothetical protein